MEISGRVHNGVVVFEDGSSLPEGTEVVVFVPQMAGELPARDKQRVEFPLVHSQHPGSLHLTNQKIAEILDAEDAAPRR